MFGIARRSVTTGTRRLDRHRIESQLLRTLRSNNGVLEKAPTRNYHSYDKGTLAVGIQRIVEAAAGSAGGNSSNEGAEGKNDRKRSLHWKSGSLLVRKADNPFSSYHDPLAKIRMPKETVSWDTLSRPSVDWRQSSSRSLPFSAKTVFQDPQQSSLGIGSRGALVHTSSARPGTGTSQRYFSTDSAGAPKSQYKTSAKIPTPKEPPNNSMFSFASFDPKALLKSLLATTWSITKTVLLFLVKLPMNAFFYLTHPQERRDKMQEIKGHARKEFDHYWTGTKVFR